MPVAGQAGHALVIGYDHRYGDDPKASRSDTLMLLRADPKTKSISMLSFPRDLTSTSTAPATRRSRDRINSAYARCGAGHARDGRAS